MRNKKSCIKLVSYSALILTAMPYISSVQHAVHAETQPNIDSVSKADTTDGVGDKLNISSSKLDEAIKANSDSVNLVQGQTQNLGSYKTSDKDTINSKIDEAVKSYESQAKEIKEKADAYKAAYKYWSENKSKTEDLVKKLNEAVKSASDLGAKLTKGETVSGKSFEEIQSSLQSQIDSLTSIANKQKDLNSKFASDTENYNTNKEAISALEAQLKTLVEQGASLGATITNSGEIKDAGTINEIKDLLQNQVNTVNELVKKQQEVVNNYKTAISEYNDKISKINSAKSALQSSISAAQANGVTVNVSESSDTKSLDEIIASYESQKSNVDSKSSESKAQNDATSAAKAEAIAKNKEIDAANQAKQDAYNKAKAEYDSKYSTYKTAKEAYDKAIEEAKSKTSEDGNLSKAIGQTLVFENEPSARVSVSGADETTTDAVKQLALSQGANTNLTGMFDALDDGAGSNEITKVYLLKKGQPITATYTNLQNTTLNGKKISKIVYTYSLNQNNIKLQDMSLKPVDWMGIGIFSDPTLTLRYAGEDNSINMDVKFYDENGNLVNTDGAVSSFASLNTTELGTDYEGVSNFNGEYIKITGSSIDNVGGTAKATTSNGSVKNGSKYEQADWDVDGSSKEYYGAIAGQSKSGSTSVNFDIVSSSRGYVWFQYNSKVKASKLPIEPIAPTPPTEPTLDPHVPIPDDNASNVNVDVTYYKAPDAPTQSNLSGSYSTYTLPEKPSQTLLDGTYNEFTIPKEPVKDTYTYHYNELYTLSTGKKSVVNADKIDINGQTVALNSETSWLLSIDNLPKNRNERDALGIEDALPEALNLDEDATKSRSTDYWTYSYDKSTHTVKYSATEKLLKEVNADLTKEFVFDADKLPSIVGKTSVADSEMNNVYKVIDTPKVSSTDKPNGDNNTPPTTTTYTNKVKVRTPKDPTPKKAVTNEDGEDINSNKVVTGSKVNYSLSWDLTANRGVTLTASQLTDGYVYVDDYDEDSVSVDAKDIKVVDKDGKEVEGLEVENYDSVEKAPKEVQAMLKKAKQSPKGKFIYIKVKDSKSFIKKYVETNDTLTIKAAATVTKDTTGKFENTGAQIDFGNGYGTNTVYNEVVKPNPTKKVTTTDGTDINTMNTTSGDTLVYKLGWNLSVYKDMLASKSEIAGGFMYLDDIDETKVEADVHNAKVVTSDNTEVPGITFTYYSSLDKAPKSVQEQFKKVKLSGGFVVANVEKPQEFYDNYVKKGVELTVVLPTKVKEDVKGEIENIAYELDFAGNKNTPKTPTNKVVNNVPTQKTKKYFQDKEKADLSDTSSMKESGTISSKDAKYSWIIKQDLDEYSVKNKLYKGMSIIDSEFADIQTVENATIYDSNKKDVSKDFDIEVYVNDELYSVNGDLTENAKKSKESSETTTSSEDTSKKSEATKSEDTKSEDTSKKSETTKSEDTKSGDTSKKSETTKSEDTKSGDTSKKFETTKSEDTKSEDTSKKSETTKSEDTKSEDTSKKSETAASEDTAQKATVKVNPNDPTSETVETDTYETNATSKKENVLLPEGLNKDGNKGNVKIVAVAKKPALINSNTYYVTLNGVSVAASSDEEYSQYVVSTNGNETKVEIGNVATSESKFGPNGKIIKTKETKAKTNLKSTKETPNTPENPTPNTPNTPTTSTTKTVTTTPAKVAETAIRKHPIMAAITTAVVATGSYLGYRKFKKKSDEKSDSDSIAE